MTGENSTAKSQRTPFDTFDPTADMGFDDEEGEYVPPIEKPDDYDAPVEKPPVPAEERIAATLKGMPGNEKLLLHVIDFCRTLQKSDDVHDEIARFVGTGICTYAPDVVCANLVRAGALEIVADEEEASHENEEYAEIDHTPAFSYIATSEGLDAVDAQNPEANRLAFLEEGERYLPVYRLVLEACSQDGGQPKKALDTLIDKHPLCKEPRRYSGFFIKGLEGIDALAFDKTWKTTDVGRDILASLPHDESPEEHEA